MTPNPPGTVTASARELVFVPAAKYLYPPVVMSGALRFRIRPDTKLPVEEIARKIKAPGMTDASVDGDSIIVRIDAGQPVPDAETVVLDVGPFEQASYTSGHLVLRRRSGRGIASIEFLAVGSEDEEWRRFLARDVDLVPVVRPTFFPYLAEVPSVALAPYSAPPSLGLLFQVQHGAFVDVRLRRALSLGLHRGAIAKAVLGGSDNALASEEDFVEAQRLLEEIRAERGDLPAVRLRYLTNATEDQRAALVLEQQLDELGFQVKLEPFEVASANDVFTKRDFEVLLTYAGVTPIYFRRALSKHAGNITGYANPEFDRAVAESDEARAIEILERDVPMTPLLTIPEAVAVDRRFCGARPRINSDLSWLADVHSCAAGETE